MLSAGDGGLLGSRVIPARACAKAAAGADVTLAGASVAGGGVDARELSRQRVDTAFPAASVERGIERGGLSSGAARKVNEGGHTASGEAVKAATSEAAEGGHAAGESATTRAGVAGTSVEETTAGEDGLKSAGRSAASTTGAAGVAVITREAGGYGGGGGGGGGGNGGLAGRARWGGVAMRGD